MGAIAGCTCCGTCDIGADTFPTDGAGAPTGWTARTGAASVVGTALEITTSNSIILFNTGHPDNIASCIVDVEIVSWGGNDPARVIVGHDGADDDDFYYCEAKLYELKLCKMTAGVPSVLKCVAHDATSGTLRVYFDGATTGVFAATLGSKTVSTTGVTSTGKYVALGLGTVDGGVTFDNFVLTKYKQSGNSCVEFTPAECAIAGDDFGRPDDTNPGCPWDELAGTGGIVSGKYVFTATTSRSRFTPSAPDGAMSVTVTFSGTASGNTIEVGVGSDSTASAMWYARLAVGATKDLILGSIAGGTLATLTNINTTVNTDYTITVTLANGRLCASFTDDNGPQFISTLVTVPTTLKYATLGTRTVVSGSIKFDNFSLSQGYEETDLPSCPLCGITTSDCTDCCPEGHTQMIVDIVGGLTDLDGDCSLCSQMDGTFVCEPLVGCNWLYCMLDEGDDDVCPDYTGPTNEQLCILSEADCTNCWGVVVGVAMRVDENMVCYLSAMLEVNAIRCPGSAAEFIMARAYYESDPLDAIAPCSGRTYTLTRYDGDEHCVILGGEYRGTDPWLPPASAGCGGSFPATITVRSAP